MWRVLPLILAGCAMAGPLTVPLSQESTDNLNAFGVLISNNMVDFLNKDINWRGYEVADGGWSPHVVSVIDGIEFPNYGQFQSYCINLRNLFKDGQVSKSQEASTTLLDDYTLSVHYCLAIALDVDMGFGSQDLNFCLTAFKYFDASGEVYKYELKSDAGIVSSLFHYVLRAVTTAMPEQGDAQTAIHLLSNPVLLTAVLLCFLLTLSCGILIGCVFNTNRAPKPKYSVVNASDSEF